MKALQINLISLTEDTKRSLPVKPVVTSYIVDKYSVHISNNTLSFFFCDLNFLHEYLISRGLYFRNFSAIAKNAKLGTISYLHIYCNPFQKTKLKKIERRL